MYVDGNNLEVKLLKQNGDNTGTLKLPEAINIGDLLRKWTLSGNIPDIKISIDNQLTKVLTPEEQKAQEVAKQELDSKVSSTGISYKDATSKMKEIKEKYKNDPSCQSEFKSEHREILTTYTYNAFDSNKLPEPSKTEYKEALAAKEEIENNNSELMKKAGLKSYTKSLPKKEPESSIQWPNNIISALKKEKPTEKQLNARTKFNELTSSTGVKYQDAKTTLNNLKEKYKNNPSCQSEFESKQPSNIYSYIPPHKEFDAYKLPEPDKSLYFKALKAAQEIEHKNSALLAQAGLNETESPLSPYSLKDINVLY